MTIEEVIWDPAEIERQSMQLIDEFMSNCDYQGVERDVVKRIIHTTGDPEILNSIIIHEHACVAGIEALRTGANVYTDVNMLAAGISRRQLQKHGGQVVCKIADADTVAAAKEWSITRAAASMRLLGDRLNGAVLAIGNAPTALFEVLRMIEQQAIKPALIVGTPVGFVGAKESKELLIAKNICPYITIRGTRGGSPSAVSAINAMLYYGIKREMPGSKHDS